jgi:hypothetical protein
VSDNYPIPSDAGGYLRREAKRAMQQARRPAFKGLREEVGPGIAPRAVQVLDWNSEECTFNGYYYSVPGVLSSPDPTTRWVGEVWAQDDFNGVQTLREAEPPAGTVEPPPEDPPAPVPSEEDPEPEPPTEGNATPIRSYTRYFSISPEGSATYTDWEPLGFASGTRLRDLAAVKVFDPLKHHDVLLWDEDYNDGEGAWVNYSWIPGIHDLQLQIDELLEDMEEEIDFHNSVIRVFRQPEVPVPGVDGVPDPIPDNSIWFDTDDDNRMRVYDHTSPDDPEFGHWVPLDLTVAQDILDAIEQAQDDATQALSDAEAAFNAANNATAAADAAHDAATDATLNAAAAIEIASLATILGDNIITNGEFDIPSVVTDPISLWAPTNSAALARWMSGAEYGIQVTTAANALGTVFQDGDLGRIPARGGESFHVTTSVATTAGGQTFKIFANTYSAAGALLATVTSTSLVAAAGGQSASSTASQNAHILIPGSPTYVRFGIQFPVASTAFWVARYVVAESVGTTRISDDAITSPKITADAVKTSELDADAITVKHTMVAPTYKTDVTVGPGNPGILINSAGLVTYGPFNSTLTITAATGAITMLGSLTSGSTITSATMTAGTITGATVQTTTTASQGVKMNSSGLIGYNGSGTPTFSLDATTGALVLLGTIQSGSTISGALLTGILQTSASPNVGVKISNSGIFGYNAAGTNVFAMTTTGTTGNLTLTGSVISGGEISGSLVTGTGLETDHAASRGIKLNSSGLLAYKSTSAGDPAVPIGTLMLAFTTSTGSLAMRGALTSGSTVTGAEVVGGMVRTASAYVNSIHMGMTDPAVAGFKVYSPGAGSMLLYIRPDVDASTPVMNVKGGLVVDPPSTGFQQALYVTGGVSRFGGTVQVDASLIMGNSGDILLGTGSDISSVGSITCSGAKDFFQGNTFLNPNNTVTPGGGDNSYVHMRVSDGFIRNRPSTSSRRFKRNIDEVTFDVPRAIEGFRGVQFQWNPAGFEADPLIPEGHEIEDPEELNTGGIAEEAHDAGLEQWVNYDPDGTTPRSIDESKIWVAQQQMIRFLWNEIKALKA